MIKGRSATSDSSLTTDGVNALFLFRKTMTMDTLQLQLPDLPHPNKLTETDSNALPGRTTTSLDLPENLPVDEWLRIGLALARAEHSLMWWIGDWWAYGEHKYGDRKALIESDNWEGPAFQTCANAATVCRKITTSLRREVLGFSAHKEIAALPAEWHEKLLAWAADGPDGKPQTIAALKEEVRRIRAFIAQGWTEDRLARQARAEAGECVVANIREGKDGRRTDEALLAWAEGTDRFVRIDRKTEWGNPLRDARRRRPRRSHREIRKILLAAQGRASEKSAQPARQGARLLVQSRALSRPHDRRHRQSGGLRQPLPSLIGGLNFTRSAVSGRLPAAPRPALAAARARAPVAAGACPVSASGLNTGRERESIAFDDAVKLAEQHGGFLPRIGRS